MQSRMKNPAVVLPDAMTALQALSAVPEKVGIPRRTLELIHLRASQINGCGVCVDMHPRIAKRFGGSVYAPGLWFASETKRFLGPEKYSAYRERKAQVDPDGLLNPGKLEPTLPRWFPIASLSWAIGLGSALAAPISRRIPSRRLPDPQTAR